VKAIKLANRALQVIQQHQKKQLKRQAAVSGPTSKFAVIHTQTHVQLRLLVVKIRIIINQVHHHHYHGVIVIVLPTNMTAALTFILIARPLNVAQM